MEPFFHLLRARSYRYLCRRCCTTVVIDPLTAVRLFCPICRESLIQQFDTPSTSPSSSPPLNLPAPPLLPNIPSRRTYMSRYATFERRDLSNDNLHVILLPGFFSCPYPNSPPFVTPLPQNHSVITLQILQNYIDYCANKGAIIHCTVPYPQAYPVMDDLIRFYGPRFGPQAASMPPDLTVTEDFLASVDSECSVCMESFKVGDVAIQLRCKHTHHKECIAPWFQIQNSCPLCRKSSTGGDRESDSTVGRFSVVLQWPIHSEVEREGTELVLFPDSAALLEALAKAERDIRHQ